MSLQSYKISSEDDTLFYHLDDVECNGNESRLADCKHGNIGAHDCWIEHQQAGVICNSSLLALHKDFLVNGSVAVYKH